MHWRSIAAHTETEHQLFNRTVFVRSEVSGELKRSSACKLKLPKEGTRIDGINQALPLFQVVE